MQREGKSVNEAVADLQNEQKVVTKYTIQITTLQNDFKALKLKKDNPSLKSSIPLQWGEFPLNGMVMEGGVIGEPGQDLFFAGHQRSTTLKRVK